MNANSPTRKTATLLSILLLAWTGAVTASDAETTAEPSVCSEAAEVIQTASYEVPVGQTVVLPVDTTIVAEHVEILGTLIGAASTDPTQAGAGICITASQLIVDGLLCGGDGYDQAAIVGSIDAGTYTGNPGSPGGSVILDVPLSGLLPSTGAVCSGAGGDGQDLLGFDASFSALGVCASQPGEPVTLIGGDGGPAGDLIAKGASLLDLAATGLTLSLGDGGAGGAADLLFGNFQGGYAYGGEGGTSGYPGASAITSGTGGEGGSAISVPCPDVGAGAMMAPVLCQDAKKCQVELHACETLVALLVVPNGPDCTSLDVGGLLGGGKDPCPDEEDCPQDCANFLQCFLDPCLKDGCLPCDAPQDCLPCATLDDCVPCDALNPFGCLAACEDGVPECLIDVCVDTDCLPCDLRASCIPSCTTMMVLCGVPCNAPGQDKVECLVTMVLDVCYTPIWTGPPSGSLSVCGEIDDITGGTLRGDSGAGHEARGDDGPGGNQGVDGDWAGFSLVAEGSYSVDAGSGGAGDSASIGLACDGEPAEDGKQSDVLPVEGAEARAGGGHGGNATVKGGKGGYAWAQGGTGGNGGDGGDGGRGLLAYCLGRVYTYDGGDGASGTNGAPGGAGTAKGGTGGTAEYYGGDGGDADGDGSYGGNGGDAGDGGSVKTHWTCQSINWPECTAWTAVNGRPKEGRWGCPGNPGQGTGTDTEGGPGGNSNLTVAGNGNPGAAPPAGVAGHPGNLGTPSTKGRERDCTTQILEAVTRLVPAS